MIHELAHNKQMNHSKHFWAVRNEFATEMKGLWDKGYSGEGLWGRGILLENGAFAREELGNDEALPEHLCGGGFRSRGKKRKPKPKITYRERRERREQKMKSKYGSGTALGGDEETRVKLEKGKRPLSNPKKANTTRGRELRAAAALARFERKEEENETKPNDDDLVTDSEAEDTGEDEAFIKSEPGDAMDQNGNPLVDTQGRHMVKICKEEDKDDEDVKRELWELQNVGDVNASGQKSPALEPVPAATSKHPESSAKNQAAASFRPQQHAVSAGKKRAFSSNIEREPEILRVDLTLCPVCSVENERTALTCTVCANVLQPEAIPNAWQCQSETCKDSRYLNAGDAGLCGVCGTRKCFD